MHPRGLLALLAAILLGNFAVADDPDPVLPPADQRFAQTGDEIPDFQRHVLPLLSRLGCNGRDCHGSFQGQGDFRLSLFGYDFAADHAALAGTDEPRVDRDQPSDSLILQKPTMQVDHDGGERFKPNGWEHELLRRWIAGGAQPKPEEAPSLVSIEVEPAEIIFASVTEKQRLRVIANWSNGEREDVTPLTRFQTNDSAVADVDASGEVIAAGPGDTHVIAFYDNGIAAVPVLLPVSGKTGNRYPDVPAPTKVDQLILAKLRKLGIEPAELCSDAEFLRRASLDICGTPPTPAEIKAFLDDASADKRSRKIDELLERPSHAAWMTTRLCDWTGNAEENLPVGGEQGVRREKSSQWYDWIYRRVADNVPYNQIVEGMVMAVGRREGQSDDEYYKEMTSYFRDEDQASFADRDHMQYFWTRGRFSAPQVLRFSYAFLGVRLECAECHKHPYDQWTQQDYEDFQIFFRQVQFRQSGKRGRSWDLKQELGLTADQDSGGYKRLFSKLAHDGTTVPWGEVVAPNWSKSRDPLRKAKGASGRVITPRLLGGEALIAQHYTDPREPVMEWLQSPDNPYFARAIVNRIWAGYFGAGIIEPTDDMNLANPASNEPLLDWLAREFIAQGYDLKWLQRTITNSHAYQRSWRPNDTNEYDDRNHSRAIVRRLPAEVLFDSLVFATASHEEQRRLQSDPAAVHARQIGFPTNYRNDPGRYATQLFGKPDREQVCDCSRSGTPSLLQTIYLRNDDDALNQLDRKGGWLAELKGHDADWFAANADDLVQEAWLRTFGRLPTDKEQTLGKEHMLAAEHPLDGLRDVLWALINSKEFVMNH